MSAAAAAPEDTPLPTELPAPPEELDATTPPEEDDGEPEDADGDELPMLPVHPSVTAASAAQRDHPAARAAIVCGMAGLQTLGALAPLEVGRFT
jgi:hypothetical protein